nr:putative reverse transcriptase domain, ribonuclease H-like domain, aspartic peptidase domain protein [Tanacetum cinerariifolium]
MRIRSPDRLLSFPSIFPLGMVPPKNLDERNSLFPHDSVLTIQNSLSRMRELVVKYKAEKVCYEEMVKIPLVSLKVLEDESFRMCIDYRLLSKIDLYSGCHQIRVHVEEILKIAFRMRYRHFELTVMLFGLTNTPAVFMELISRVEIGESKMIGLELEQETTKVFVIKERLKEAKVHLEEIKVDKTLCFVEEHVEINDREVKSLKRSRIPIVKSTGTQSEVMRIS